MAAPKMDIGTFPAESNMITVPIPDRLLHSKYMEPELMRDAIRLPPRRPRISGTYKAIATNRLAVSPSGINLLRFMANALDIVNSCIVANVIPAVINATYGAWRSTCQVVIGCFSKWFNSASIRAIISALCSADKFCAKAVLKISFIFSNAAARVADNSSFFWPCLR